MRDGVLYQKYLVERSDGETHPASRYFVLNYAADPAARVALVAYAEACAASHPILAGQLLDLVAYYEARDN